MLILTDNVIDNRACQCVYTYTDYKYCKLTIIKECTTPWTQVETVIVFLDNKWILNRHNGKLECMFRQTEHK